MSLFLFLFLVFCCTALLSFFQFFFKYLIHLFPCLLFFYIQDQDNLSWLFLKGMTMIRMTPIQSLHLQRRLQKNYFNLLLMPLYRQEDEFNQICMDQHLLRLLLLFQSLLHRRRSQPLHWSLPLEPIRVTTTAKQRRKEDGRLLKKELLPLLLPLLSR